MTQTILLVEDDLTAQLSFKLVIEKTSMGIFIHTLNNGIQAKSYLENAVANSDLCLLPTAIVTDVYMPCISGLDLLVWVKQHPLLKNIPVIVMSSVDDLDQVNLAMDLGAISYYHKLSPINNLICLIKSILPWLLHDYVC